MKYTSISGLRYAVFILHEVLNSIAHHYEIRYYFWFTLCSAYVTRSVKYVKNHYKMYYQYTVLYTLLHSVCVVYYIYYK